MFEAKLSEGVILKKIVDSIKDLVTDVNIDISPSGRSTHKFIKQTIKTHKLKKRSQKIPQTLLYVESLGEEFKYLIRKIYFGSVLKQR